MAEHIGHVFFGETCGLVSSGGQPISIIHVLACGWRTVKTLSVLMSVEAVGVRHTFKPDTLGKRPRSASALRLAKECTVPGGNAAPYCAYLEKSGISG